MSVERSESEVGSKGRAVHRKDSSATGASSVHSGSAASVPLVEPLAHMVQDIRLHGEGSGSGSSGKTGNGNGNGGASAGRGSTRGRRDRAEEWVRRTRPDEIDSKVGKSGKAVNVTTNYFNLLKRPSWRLFKYRVDMVPEEDHMKRRKALLYVHKEKLPQMMFDGTLAFMVDRMDQDPMVLESTNRDGTVVRITLRLVEELTPNDFHYMQFFNIVLRKVMEGLGLTQIRRDFFDPKAKKELKQYKLEVWPGYVTTINQMEQNLMLSVKVEHKVLRMDTVHDQISTVIGKNRDNYRAAVTKELLGKIVMTRYNNETYKIDDIAWNENPMSTFNGRHGEITYVDYYQNKYNRAIRDLKQPLIISLPTLRDKRACAPSEALPKMLIPELCNMTGLTDDQRNNFQLMKAMGDITRPDPEKRVQALRGFSDRLANTPECQAVLKSWHIEFAQDLANFRARCLDPEPILGSGNAKFQYKSENADWSGAFRNWKQVSAMKLDKWVVLHPPKAGDQVKEFLNCISKVGPSLGMIIAKPKVYELGDTRPTTYVKELRIVVAQSQPRLVMIIIPSKTGEHYAAVKNICCVESAVPSQVITSSVLAKPKGLMSVATKVVVQMNCKMGGEPWAVDIPMKNTMVLGYDTYHDSLHKDKSAGALVASLNKNFTRFISSAHIHDRMSEMTDHMVPAVTKALRKYIEVNGQAPERVIMYRDGVGDGQISYVLDHEVAAIEQCFKMQRLEGVKFTYVIVSKRINTKFFAMNGKPGNVNSGTIVDDVVTQPERYDFFLVSQSVTQGTVNPTSYNIVKDTSGLKPEHMQRLTYKLTHLYYNWPGTVRVPAPCQYAHKLALLVGDALHKVPSPTGEMNDLLYFL